ncbi:hypothetical protein [Nonomuraea bangladeshensis]
MEIDMRHPGKVLALIAGIAVMTMIMRELPALKRYITMSRM